MTWDDRQTQIYRMIEFLERHGFQPVGDCDKWVLWEEGYPDPDGDQLRSAWIYYPEPGTYKGKFNLSSRAGKMVSLAVPSDFAKGHSIHIILAVTDGGAPALTRYRRIIVECR